jgi:hypothetical protein
MKKIVQTSKVRPDPNNPRTIRDDKFAALVKSLQEFPEMLEKRPIVVTQEYVALGGNMRLKAAKEAGFKTVWVFVTNWTEQQQREFRYKDNSNAGAWNEDMLRGYADKLEEWMPGEFDYVTEKPAKIDYTFLNEEGGEFVETAERKTAGSRYGLAIQYTDLGLHAATQKMVTKARQQGIDVNQLFYKAVEAIHKGA